MVDMKGGTTAAWMVDMTAGRKVVHLAALKAVSMVCGKADK